MRRLWSRSGFRRLWLGETISLLGDWLSYVAVSLFALESGQGALGLAVVYAAHVLPNALLAPWAGAVADRSDRRRILWGTQVVMAAAMVAMVLAAAAGSLALVQALLFLRNAVGAFFYPAKQSALRSLVADEDLGDANALDAATWSATFCVGTALGGVVALAGPLWALAADAATFVVAALILARLPALPALASEREPSGKLGAALAHALARPALLEAVLSKTPIAVASGAAWILVSLVAGRGGFLGGAALSLGALQALRGLATGVGPLLARRFGSRSREAGRALMRASAWVALAGIGLLALGASVPALTSAPALGLAGVALATVVWGLGDGSLWVWSSTELQRRAPPAMLGRLAAADMLAFTCGQGLAAIAAGALVYATVSVSAAGWLGAVAGVGSYLALRWLARPRRSPAAVAASGLAPASEP
jgi:predicted MFS family arabinose efflux permease